MSAWKVAVLVAALGAQLGCAVLVHPSDVHVAWATARWPDATLAELSQGRTEYVDHCAGCHTLVRPETQAPEDWPDLVREMEDEQGVELTADERRRIVWYLEVAAAIPVVAR